MTHTLTRRVVLGVAIFFLSLVAMPHGASAATEIYYSVGSDTTTNYLTGTNVTVTIDGSGNATFSAAQTASSTGVGDIVTYGGQRAFITGKTSTSVWTVETATGTLPAATTSAPVASITHAFSNLKSAVGAGVAGNATSTNFLNTSDLVAGNYVLNIPAYNDNGTPETTDGNMNIGGFTTGPSNYINIYTPTSTTTQANASQRHNGTYNTAVGYAIQVAVNANILTISTGYVRIDGIQIHNVNGRGEIDYAANVYPEDVYLSNSIIDGFSNPSLYFRNNNSEFHFWNNLFIGTPSSFTTEAIDMASSHATSTVYNNTFYNFTYGINLGNCGTSGPVSFVNNLFASTTNPISTTCYTATDSGYNSAASSSIGYYQSPHPGDVTNATYSFFDLPNGNFDLTSSDTGAKDLGTSSPATDASAPFSTDILGNPRPYGSAWDIGAFEYTPTADVTPPGLSGGAPTGQIANGSTSTTLSVDTNENATCKYDTVAGTAYASMPYTFTTTGGTAHSTTVTGLQNGHIYNYYVRCEDTSNNVDTSDYTITFEVNQGTNGTVYAQSCSVADTNAAMAYVNDGDTLSIPAGTCGGYSSSGGLAITKAITVEGAGEGQTVLQISSTTPGTYFSGGVIALQAAATLKNLTIETDTSSTANSGTAIVVSGGVDGFRVSNVQYINRTTKITGYFMGVGTGAYGLIDHNDITGDAGNNELILVYGPTDSWQEPNSMGGSRAVYIEDNTIGGNGYVTDCNANSRCVVRDNTITGPIKIDGHGKASNTPARGVRQYEAYDNQWTDTTDVAWPAIEMRGGTGMIFNNTASASAGSNAAWFYLTDYGYTAAWGNFSNIFQTPTNYPVDDQIGVGEDPKAAASEPYYVWGNTMGGQWWPLDWKSVSESTISTDAAGYSTGATTITLSKAFSGTLGSGNYVAFAGDSNRYQLATTLSNGQTTITIASPGLLQSIPAAQTTITYGPNTNYQGQTGNSSASFVMSDVIKPNRDFYVSSTSVAFDGTANGTSAGVGSGTYASMPATCTTGVGYWATDKGGNWDASNGTSEDGALYKCTATNTWTLSYTPYAYPDYLTAASTTDSDKVDIGGGARFFGNGKFYAVSTSTMSGVYATLGATTTPIADTTASSSADYWLDATISKWLTSGTYEKTWTETSTTLHATTTHQMVGDLAPNAAYALTIDGSPAVSNVSSAQCSSGTCTSDSTGTIYFDYTGGYSTHTFDLVQSGAGTVYAPTVTTQAASSITTASATGNGDMTSTGGANATVRGFTYGLTTAYGATTTESGSFSAGTFTGSIASLTCGTTYHIRAYATNSTGTGYGSDTTFTTSACPTKATVTTQAVTSIGQTTATGNGTITSTGGENATAEGVAIGLTTTYSDFIGSSGSFGAGSFTENISGLSCNTTYHIAAYATNPVGTSYGSDTTFTTSACAAPTVTTGSASSLGQTTATLGGSISNTGGHDATDAGFALGTASDLSSAATTSVGAETGNASFTSSQTGLTCGTTYYFRAYATNTTGTGYGSIVSFTTSSCSAPVSPPTVTTQATTVIGQTTATGNGTITSTGGENASSEGIAYGLTTAYTATSSSSGSFGAASFSKSLTGLTCGTTYHAAAFASNTGGTGYGPDVSFTTSACSSSGSGSSGSSGSGSSAPFSSGRGQSASASAAASSQLSAQVVSGSSASTAAVSFPSIQAFVEALIKVGVIPETKAATALAAVSAASAPSASSAAAPAPRQNLARGYVGPSVRALQETLNSLGYDVSASGAGSPGHETTVFGPATKAALIRFQKAHGIPPTGFYGPLTRAALGV